MVKPTLVITVDGPADGELVHRFRNFAEDLLREFLQRDAARVENPDSATDRLVIAVSAPRRLGQTALNWNQLSADNLIYFI